MSVLIWSIHDFIFENRYILLIERHYRELGKDIHSAVFEKTKEIMLADLSGTVTTILALAPMLFMGGYPQTIFAPLVGTLLLALVASYIISITAVPLLSLYFLSLKNPILLKVEDGFHSLISHINDVIQSSFASIVKAGIRYKSVSLLYAVILIALIAMFNSIKISLMILFSIPLTIIGASWTMLARC